MLALKEKHLKSFRYIFRIFVYTTDMFLLICSYSMIKLCAIYRDTNKLSELITVLSGQIARMTEDARILVDGVILLFLFLCLGIFMSLNRFIKYDMLLRAPERVLSSAMGWRRLQIAQYEITFFLFDVWLAWLLSSAVFWGLWHGIKNQTILLYFLNVAGITTIFGAMDFVFSGVVIGLLTAVFVALKVEI